VAAVRSPGFGESKKDQLRDIAAVLGAHLLSEDEGHDIANLNSNAIGEILGSCEKLTVTSSKTTLVTGQGERSAIEARIQEIKSQIEFKDNESEKLLLKERLAKLEGGVAILKIGAYSEIELKEKKDRLDDALSATQAAIADGILPGGGIALLNAAEYLSSQIFENHLIFSTDDEKMGAKILIESCSAPLFAILDNAGVSFDVVKNEILRNSSLTYGYDARLGVYVDMVEVGIIDPTKVTKSALENAVSISGMMLTTECTLVEEGPASEVKIEA
jgi:chaperonin GroEL